MKHLLKALSLCLITAHAAHAQPALTIYNDDFGVVRDTVPLELSKGVSEVTYSGVTSELEPESVLLRDPSGNVQLSILEQSYRGDPVDQMRLLQMFEGKTIEFLKTVGEDEAIIEGRIIRAPSIAKVRNYNGHRNPQLLQPIIEVEDVLMTRLPGEPLFPSLGDDSVLKPTLSWKLHSSETASLDAQLSYLTRGMSWKADYNLVLPEKGDTVTLNGWVSVTNRTGKTFEDAKIKLIAGDVNKVEEHARGMRDHDGANYLMAAKAAPAVEEKKFDEFHMYSLPLPTTLRDQETKQLEFVRAEGVATRKLYVYDGANLGNHWRSHGVNTNQNFGTNNQPDVAIYRELENREENNLGIPLPAGKIRFYRMDDDGQLEFTGENVIDHTPKNETVRVYLGNAFDLVGERTRTSFYKHPQRDMMRESFTVEIRNRSEETVTVQVVEHLFRGMNWELTEKSQDYEKKNAQTIVFPVTIEPDGTEKVSYTVEYTW